MNLLHEEKVLVYIRIPLLLERDDLNINERISQTENVAFHHKIAGLGLLTAFVMRTIMVGSINYNNQLLQLCRARTAWSDSVIRSETSLITESDRFGPIR